MQNQVWALDRGYGLDSGLETSNPSPVSKGVVSLAVPIFKLGS